MIEFADQTGLADGGDSPRRYLWTDAHAVCNFLSLYRRTGEDEFKHLALHLIDQVHNILGKHREDDPRYGWISGLTDKDGHEHPTAGGLRIGKELNERGPDDALDDRLEWDRDGQYFHYLTKWMHALYRAGVVTGEVRYCRWAMELAKAAHAGFAKARLPEGRKYLVWKMSIDLSYPLVPSAGLHDPLDGYITYKELDFYTTRVGDDSKLPELDTEIAETAAMNEGQRWATDDPLGIGGLLFDGCRVFQLMAVAHLENPGLAETLMRDTTNSLESFTRQTPLNQPAQYRLAFRELGLSIGLRAVTLMQDIVERQSERFGKNLQQDLEGLREYVPLGAVIENFWRKSGNQQVNSWLDHRDINSVMLATSLLPDQFLAL
jgi:hypothetical protein